MYLNKVGDTATAKITYKTNKYTTDGKPDGNIGPNEVTIGTNHKIKLVPVKEGVAYIFVKKDDKIVSSVPVTVVAARKVTTMTADKTGFSVSNTVGAANVVVTLAVKDQYGNDFNYIDGTDGTIDVTCEGASSFMIVISPEISYTEHRNELL